MSQRRRYIDRPCPRDGCKGELFVEARLPDFWFVRCDVCTLGEEHAENEAFPPLRDRPIRLRTTVIVPEGAPKVDEGTRTVEASVSHMRGCNRQGVSVVTLLTTVGEEIRVLADRETCLAIWLRKGRFFYRWSEPWGDWHLIRAEVEEES